MECPSCGAHVAPGKFCTDCGAALPGRCPGCGAANPPAARFCAECGAHLGGAQAEPVYCYAIAMGEAGKSIVGCKQGVRA
jgi:predicted amidophosphoribosyltransferase